MSLTHTIAARSRQRFVRWDDQAWHAFCDGPARAYATHLGHTPHAPHQRLRLLEDYLHLAAEALGSGFLSRHAITHPTTLFPRAFLELAPEQLPTLSPSRQSTLLAQLFNLGENLAIGPSWRRRLVEHCLRELSRVDDLIRALEHAEDRIFSPPRHPLEPERAILHWIPTHGLLERFLPGTLSFLSPTVLCVHDRVGEDRIAIWLETEPVVLGVIREPLPAPGPGHALRKVWDTFALQDPRLTQRYTTRRNAWRSAATLKTSQFVVALMPEDPT